MSGNITEKQTWEPMPARKLWMLGCWGGVWEWHLHLIIVQSAVKLLEYWTQGQLELPVSRHSTAS